MQIRKKLGLIVAFSIVVTSIPLIIWISSYIKSSLIEREILNLNAVIIKRSEMVRSRLMMAEPKLASLARLIQDEIEKPINEYELKAFYRVMVLDDDGIWRNLRDNYNGLYESGIFLPDSPTLTDKQKVNHLRIKQIMDRFGAAANRHFENVWFLSDERSEVIYDKYWPNFVYEMNGASDYTVTPWVQNTSPEINPDRKFVFTPPLFDPPSQIWMLSALYPVYDGDKWIGSVGEDVQLTEVLQHILTEEEHYQGTEHFLFDEKEQYLLAGPWQAELEATMDITLTADKKQLIEPMIRSFINASEPTVLSKNFYLDGVQYLVLGMRIDTLNWSYIRLIPIKYVIASVQELLSILIFSVVLCGMIGGVIISMTINHNIVSRINKLTNAMTSYRLGGRKNSLAIEIQGRDEITQAAREFDVMVERLKEYHEVMESTNSALQKSEERWKFALEGAGDGVWDVDLLNNEVVLSKQGQLMFGLDKIGSRLSLDWWFEQIHPEEREAARKRFDDYIAGHHDTYNSEYRFRCGDGHYKWILDRGMTVRRDELSKPLHLTGTLANIDALKTTQAELHQYSNQLREILDYSPIAVRIIQKNSQKVVFANQRYADMLNMSIDEVIGLDPLCFYQNPAEYESCLLELEQRGTSTNQLIGLKIPGTNGRWALVSFRSIYYENESCIIGWFYDITDRLQAEQKMSLHASVYDNAWEAIMITDKNNNIISVNQAFTEITGYSEAEVIGKNPSSLSSDIQGPEFYREMWNQIQTGGRWRGEIWNRKKNGEIYAERLTVSVIKDAQGNIINYLGLFADITEVKQTETQLKNLAHYDALTNLANRTLLSSNLGQAVANAKSNTCIVAACFLDLDAFKPVNDQYGHEIGDKLLVEVAKRLKGAVRHGDTVARMGGDEFVVLLNNLTSIDELDPLLTRIISRIADNIIIDDIVLNISASIGVAVYPLDDVDVDTLLRHADLAMYEAKQAGRNGYRIFDVKLDQQLHQQHARLEQIISALQNDEFCIFLQPQVNIHQHRVTGMEALIRWHHPERGLLGAGEFLPYIETHELIVSVGDWVLDAALQQLHIWQLQGVMMEISVNVSARQVQHPDFISKLEQLFSRYPDVPAHMLELELTETSVLETKHAARIIQDAVDKLGVRFALDDFGTGYSSLKYLGQLPVQTLKIDQTFVSNMLSDKENLAIVKGIIELAEIFKLDLIAEGVETLKQAEKLMELGCEVVQGFGVARPMPADKVIEWVNYFNEQDISDLFKVNET